MCRPRFLAKIPKAFHKLSFNCEVGVGNTFFIAKEFIVAFGVNLYD